MSKNKFPANRVLLVKANGNFTNNVKANHTEKTRFPVNSSTMTTHVHPEDYHYALIPKRQTPQHPPRRKVTFVSNAPKLNLIRNGVVSVETPYGQ